MGSQSDTQIKSYDKSVIQSKWQVFVEALREYGEYYQTHDEQGNLIPQEILVLDNTNPPA